MPDPWIVTRCPRHVPVNPSIPRTSFTRRGFSRNVSAAQRDLGLDIPAEAIAAYKTSLRLAFNGARPLDDFIVTETGVRAF